MTFLSDDALGRLRDAVDWPDLSGTRYDALETIGHGGMATVFRVRDTLLERDCAMKVLRLPEADPHLTPRLQREALILADLEHPGIVPVHDVGVLPDGRVFYVMKLVRGRRLDEVVAANAELGERLRVFERICEAVAFAHARGVIHRDLKPANVMVGEYGEVLVLDWGVARVVNAPEPRRSALNPDSRPDATSDGVVVGTPGYMAPEQVEGRAADVGPHSDVFALGAILKYLVVPPGNSATAPRALTAIAEKAMAAEPAERYASVDELARDVARYQQGLAVGAYRESLVDRAARLARRHQTAILLVVGYLLLRVVLIFLTGR